MILNNGLNVPVIGLGAKIVFAHQPVLKKRQYDLYLHAMTSGKCMLFDTGESYGVNEEILGQACADACVREKIRFITKIGNDSQRRGGIRKSLERSLKRLRTDYVDVYLIHWPQWCSS